MAFGAGNAPYSGGVVKPLTTGQGWFAQFGQQSNETNQPRARPAQVEVERPHAQCLVHLAYAYRQAGFLD